MLLFILAGQVTGFSQPVFTGTEIFSSEDFAARRAKVLAEIGDAVAILQGTTERPGEQPFRQAAGLAPGCSTGIGGAGSRIRQRPGD